VFLRTHFSIAAAALIVLLTGTSGCQHGDPDTTSSPDQQGTIQDLISREGVNVEYSVKPVGGSSDTVLAGGWADVVFRITDAGTGDPIKGRYPAAWMDLAKAWDTKGGEMMSCQDRVATYLQGLVGVRPMIDLNSHFLLVLNRDPSISVIDPAVGITGITNLFAQINLSRPGADWTLNQDDKRLFVTMPGSGKLAVIDTDSFQVTHEIEAGPEPMRVELQNDGRYLWIGNNAADDQQSGVTVIDAADLTPVAFIATGAGHHEVAFTDDDRYAFVTNRDAGTVSVIDVQTLERVKDIPAGAMPMAIAFSPLSQTMYVTDATDGRIRTIDPAQLEVSTSIETLPGLGPLRFAPGGRWGVTVNSSENRVFVIDASDNRLAHEIPVGLQPFQVSFTNSFAYIRSLGTQDVGLIPLSTLDDDERPPVTYITAGQRPPGIAADIGIADSIVPSVKQGAAAYIVNQAEGTISYYMEGMGAPMGSFRNYGHETRAIEIVDRSLGEEEPGVYRGRVKIPVEGSYDVAFMMDTPRFLHCFTADVAPDPAKRLAAKGTTVEYHVDSRRVAAGESSTIRFRLIDTATTTPVLDAADVTVLYYGSDGRDRTVTNATPVGQGLYEATLDIRRASTYYIFVGSASRKLDYPDQPFLSLMGRAPAVAGAGN
jgi:YVTN family beta-propeller protein